MAALEEQDDDGDQQQKTSRERIEEELDGGVNPVRPSPDADEQVHGDQHRLPEDVEQHEIQGAEDADHRRLHDQHGDHEFPHTRFDGGPRGDDADRREQGGEQDQPEADAVDAQGVADGGSRDPLGHFPELHLRPLRLKPEIEGHGQEKLKRRGPEGHMLDGRLIFEKSHDGDADHRQQDQQRQQVRQFCRIQNDVRHRSRYMLSR